MEFINNSALADHGNRKNMIIYSNVEKKAYYIERLALVNGVVRSLSYLIEKEIYPNDDEMFFGAQRIDYRKLTTEGRGIKVYGEGYTFSQDTIRELIEIKSEQEFKDKYFPRYKVEPDRDIRIVEYSEK